MQFLDPALDTYSETHSAPEPSYLRQLAGETRAKVRMPQMLSGHVQGRFLSLLSHLVRPELVLDIGTFTGYSALCMAEGLRPGGQVHTIDINTQLTPMVKRYIAMAGVEDRITVHSGEALRIVPTIAGTIDMVFIDADKGNYGAYYDLVVDRVRPGGLIIADNVLWSGKVVADPTQHDEETAALAAYARKVKADERVEPVLVPLRDGLLVARRK